MACGYHSFTHDKTAWHIFDVVQHTGLLDPTDHTEVMLKWLPVSHLCPTRQINMQ